MTHSVRVATMRAAGLFVAISSVQALAPTAKRRDIGAFLGGAALTTLAPRPALADVKIDPNSVRTTKGGAKYVVVKEGACPLIDPSGALGSCYPVRKSTSRRCRGLAGSVERCGTGIATPSSRRRVDGVEVDATIQRERAVKF